ncbi:MAG TPA: tryptophan synthase subunit alpha [Dehalococcoidia bacterium]|nr:tryptophan synthase subunit alpha [Dehalococcoidia bacterium]
MPGPNQDPPPGRIEAAFQALKAEGRSGLIAFLTVGYPSVEATLALVPALVEGGACAVELGVPFSDPLADGATIQRASHHALARGVTPAVCLDVVRRLRAGGVQAPLILMGYYNPILARGVESFAREAASAGADGLIVVDLPPEESEPLRAACLEHGLRLIYLLAPTSSDERIRLVAGLASGFVYCVSLTGTTGAREDLPPGLTEFIARVRRHTPLPIAVGFGISKPKHFRAVGRIADAAVIGSAIIDEIDRSGPSQQAARVREYVEVVTGRRRAAT